MTEQNSTGTEQTKKFYYIHNWVCTLMEDSETSEINPCYRFNVQDLSEEDRNELTKKLKEHGIVFEIRASSSGHGAGTINKGDQTLCIIGKENVNKLRKFIKNPQTQLSLDWKNYRAWENCSVPYGKDSVLHTYRLNVQDLSPEQLEQLRYELFMKGVDVAIRKASVASDGIKKGDSTLRVVNKESVENLEGVWQWTRIPLKKHIESTKEYNDRQNKEQQRYDAARLLADQKWIFQGGRYSIQIEDTTKQRELQAALSSTEINYDIINNDTIKIKPQDTYNLLVIVNSVAPQEELQTQAASHPAEGTPELNSGEQQEKLNSKKEFVKTDSAPQKYKNQEKRGRESK